VKGAGGGQGGGILPVGGCELYGAREPGWFGRTGQGSTRGASAGRVERGAGSGERGARGLGVEAFAADRVGDEGRAEGEEGRAAEYVRGAVEGARRGEAGVLPVGAALPGTGLLGAVQGGGRRSALLGDLRRGAGRGRRLRGFRGRVGGRDEPQGAQQGARGGGGQQRTGGG